MQGDINELINGCKSGERKAQHRMYQLFYPRMMAVAYRYNRNEQDAAALVNEAFFKAFTGMDKYLPEVPFELWLRKILTNTIIDAYRRNKRVSDLLVDTKGGELPEFDEYDYAYLEKELRLEQAEEILGKLDETERMVFNLYEIDGYTHKDIVEMTGVSERSSKRYLANARLAIKKIVAGVMKTASVILL